MWTVMMMQEESLRGGQKLLCCVGVDCESGFDFVRRGNCE